MEQNDTSLRWGEASGGREGGSGGSVQPPKLKMPENPFPRSSVLNIFRAQMLRIP